MGLLYIQIYTLSIVVFNFFSKLKIRQVHIWKSWYMSVFLPWPTWYYSMANAHKFQSRLMAHNTIFLHPEKLSKDWKKPYHAYFRKDFKNTHIKYLYKLVDLNVCCHFKKCVKLTHPLNLFVFANLCYSEKNLNLKYCYSFWFLYYSSFETFKSKIFKQACTGMKGNSLNHYISK